MQIHTFQNLLLPILLFLAALLYSSVGHGGGSGYLAAMAFLSLAPETMKPTALSLNVIVSSIAFFKFYRAGCFSAKPLLPFVITSIPFSLWGGTLFLPKEFYSPFVGAILLYAAGRLILNPSASDEDIKETPLSSAMYFGAGIGFFSGLIGIGGGIFLTPLLIFMRWAKTHEAAGLSAAFVLVNSISGLTGMMLKSLSLPDNLPILGIVVAVGGWIGASYGSRQLSATKLRQVLAMVLLIASVKMVF